MRVKQFLTMIVLLLCGASQINAQYENIWVFGGGKSGVSPNGAGLDFNNNNLPKAIRTSINGMSGGSANASVCDRNGQLQFYTEGDNIWSKDGNLMPNGTNITQLTSNYAMFNATVNTSQGALIVAMPDSANKFYVFSLTSADAVMGAANAGKLFYSIVDMNLNGGMGDIMPGKKGILIDSNLSEHMTPVAGNECNVWVVVMPLMRQAGPGRASQFKAYEITKNGLSSSPVVSPPMDYIVSAQSRGTLAFSSDRKKLAAGRQNLYPGKGVSGTLELYDFDAATGIVSNQIILDKKTPIFLTSGYNGVCFSPDDSKLYGQFNGLMPFDPSAIFQFDLRKGNADTIIKSKTMITQVGYETQIKAGPDGKLYFFSYDHPLVQSPDDSILGVINFPNLKGAASQVALTAPIVFLPGTAASIGLPNTVGMPRMIDTVYKSNNLIVCSNQDTVLLEVDDKDAFWYQWDDSSTTQSRKVTEVGTYWMKRSNYCHTRIDTFVVIKVNLNPLISVNQFELSTTLSYDTYQWYLNNQIIPGATKSSLHVTENGDYAVMVSNDSICSEISPIYKITNVTSIQDASSIAPSIAVYPNPTKKIIFVRSPIEVNLSLTNIEGKVLKETNNTKQISLYDLADGIYFLQIYNLEGSLIKTEKIVKTP